MDGKMYDTPTLAVKVSISQVSSSFQEDEIRRMKG